MIHVWICLNNRINLTHKFIFYDSLIDAFSNFCGSIFKDIFC